MKQTKLFSFIPLSEKPLFYTIIFTDFVLFSITSFFNFHNMKFDLNGAKTILFRYYIIVILAFDLLVLILFLIMKKHNRILNGFFVIIRVMAYIFMIFMQINTLHDFRSNEVIVRTRQQHNWFTAFSILMLIIYFVNIKMSFALKDIIDDINDANEAENTKNQELLKNESKNEGDLNDIVTDHRDPEQNIDDTHLVDINNKNTLEEEKNEVIPETKSDNIQKNNEETIEEVKQNANNGDSPTEV